MATGKEVEAVREGIAPVFNLVFQFRRPEAQAKTVFADFRGQVKTRIADFEKKAQSAGVRTEALTWIKEALAGFVDEEVLRSSWKEKPEWAKNPLQNELFGFKIMGARFYQNLGVITDGHPEVLEAYSLCLSAGFKGQLQNNRPEWRQKTRDAIARIAAIRDRMDRAITPKAFPDKKVEARSIPRSISKVHVAVALALAVLAVGSFFFFDSWVGRRAGDVEREIRASGSVK